MTLHIVEVVGPLLAPRFAQPVRDTWLAGVPVAGMVHIGLGVVEAEPHPDLGAGFCQLGTYVFAIRGACDLVVGPRRVEHAKAIVVLGGEDNVAHPRLSGHLHPGPGLKVNRVEPLWQGKVLGFADGWLLAKGRGRQLRNHNRPRGFDPGDRIGSPVDEQTELGFPEPVQPPISILDARRLAYHLSQPPRFERYCWKNGEEQALPHASGCPGTVRHLRMPHSSRFPTISQMTISG